MTMALACSTSAFKVPLADALAGVHSLGFQYVDLIAIPQWNHIDPVALADDWEPAATRVSELLAQHALTPVALNCAVPHLHQRAPDIVEQRLCQVEGIAKLMNHLNVEVASFYPGYKVDDRPWDDVFADTVTTIRELRGVARAYHVRFVIELHYATPFQTVAQSLKLLDAVKDLQIAYDPSHFAMQDIDLRKTEPLLVKAAHVHLRDAGPGKMQMPMGTGTVDFKWILDTLAAIDYHGHYSIEYLPNLEDVDDSITALRDQLAPRLG
jgi:sugar phosphate isomerase/epimerase